MKITNVKELYEAQKAIWREENEEFFGITPLDEWSDLDVINQHLTECADKFWNNGTNRFKEILEKPYTQGGKMQTQKLECLVPNSYVFDYDVRDNVIVLSAYFNYDIENPTTKEMTKEKIKRPLVYFPSINSLCWVIGESEWILRVQINPNRGLFTRNGDIISYQKTWTYDLNKKEFTIFREGFDPFEQMTKINEHYLTSCYGQPITKDNFEDALASIKELDYNSILRYTFNHVDAVFDRIRTSDRFANPKIKAPIAIDVAKIISNIGRMEDDDDNAGMLVLSKSKIYALENSRTAVLKNMYKRDFNFVDCVNIFDAFKTSTDKSAGKSRLLLDDIIIKDGILYNKVIDENGNEVYKDMYEIVLFNLNVKRNISVLSESMFCENNDSKRIMMTNKLRAQALPVKGEVDDFTHEIPARIVFGDFKGFNFGDNIIISHSFAKRLESRAHTKINLNIEGYRFLKNKYNIGDEISLKDFKMLAPGNNYRNYREVKLINLNTSFMTITARIPFSIGDKLTNLHGSKGIVSQIVEDDKMPILVNDLGPNMKAGPIDVIVSGLSVYRRKSLGQIIEAWARATDHFDCSNLVEASEKYIDEMQEYSNKSVISWNGNETIKPCGINMMIRLDHNACSKQVFAELKTNYSRLLKCEEMLILNLISRGLYDISNELDIRSIAKHHNAIAQIKNMQKTGAINNEPANNLKFFNILRAIGFDFNLRNPDPDSLKIPDEFITTSILEDDVIDLDKKDKNI